MLVNFWLMVLNFSFDASALSALEDRRKKNQIETQELQNCRNTQSKSIGKAKAAGEDIKPLLNAVADLGDSATSITLISFLNCFLLNISI
jgi:seryl-tRNA synthetase